MNKIQYPFDESNEYFKGLSRVFLLRTNGDDYYFTWNPNIDVDPFDFVINPQSMVIDPYDDNSDKEILTLLRERFSKSSGINREHSKNIYDQFGFLPTERIPPKMIHPLQMERYDTLQRAKKKLRVVDNWNQAILNILKVIVHQTSINNTLKIKEISKHDNSSAEILAFQVHGLRNKLNEITKALEECRSGNRVNDLLVSFFDNNRFLNENLSDLSLRVIKKMISNREDFGIKDVRNLALRYFTIDEILEIHLSGRLNEHQLLKNDKSKAGRKMDNDLADQEMIEVEVNKLIEKGGRFVNKYGNPKPTTIRDELLKNKKITISERGLFDRVKQAIKKVQ